MTLPLWFLVASLQAAPRRVPEDPLPPLEGRAVELSLPAADGSSWSPGRDGRPAVLYFWARWCRPCIEHLRDFQALEERLPGVSLLAVALDRDPAVPRAVVSRMEDFHLTLLLDSQARLYGELGLLERAGLPALLVLDAQGRVLGLVSGFDPARTPAELREVLRGAD